jgi:ABC-2 type transport system ATP-binding protein
MGDQAAIKVNDLSKDFDEIHAVQSVSFAVQAGEIFSLLGPNGAGKSTTISMLSCLLEPTSGDAMVMGHSILREATQVRSQSGLSLRTSHSTLTYQHGRT